MSQEIRIKKSDLWKYSTFLLLVIVVISAFFVFKGPSENKGELDISSLLESNDPVLGNEDAEITILEFSDFECIFCARAYEGSITDFKASDYFKNGKVNLVYKQMPLDTACNSLLRQQIHPNACKSAEASLCADEQGKFWEYHDLLYTNQDSLSITNLKDYATQIDLDSSKFNKCLDDGKYASEVKKEISQGASAGGSGTPFFVVINKKTKEATSFSGAYPFASGTAQNTLEDAIKAVQ